MGQTPTGTATYDVLNASNQITQVLTVPVYRQQDRRSQAITSLNTGFSVANTWYNSLAVTVRRPFNNGLEVLGNYTWARATDTGQVQGPAVPSMVVIPRSIPTTQRATTVRPILTSRNRFTLSFVYKPQIFSDNKWVKHLFDDFTFAGAEIASGGPANLSGNAKYGLLRYRHQPWR